MSNLTKEEIFNSIQKNKDFIKKEFGVKELYLFGSYARDNNKENSDVDFLVEFYEYVENKTTNLLEFCVFLEDIFECRIDIGEKRNIKKEYEKDILSSKIVNMEI